MDSLDVSGIHLYAALPLLLLTFAVAQGEEDLNGAIASVCGLCTLTTFASGVLWLEYVPTWVGTPLNQYGTHRAVHLSTAAAVGWLLLPLLPSALLAALLWGHWKTNGPEQPRSKRWLCNHNRSKARLYVVR